MVSARRSGWPDEIWNVAGSNNGTGSYCRLFDKLTPVQEFYQGRINPASEELILRRYRTALRKEFFPVRGFPKARLSLVKKTLSDYRKIAHNPAKVVDLMVFSVEMAILP